MVDGVSAFRACVFEKVFTLCCWYRIGCLVVSCFGLKKKNTISNSGGRAEDFVWHMAIPLPRLSPGHKAMAAINAVPSKGCARHPLFRIIVLRRATSPVPPPLLSLLRHPTSPVSHDRFNRNRFSPAQLPLRSLARLVSPRSARPGTPRGEPE